MNATVFCNVAKSCKSNLHNCKIEKFQIEFSQFVQLAKVKVGNWDFTIVELAKVNLEIEISQLMNWQKSIWKLRFRNWWIGKSQFGNWNFTIDELPKLKVWNWVVTIVEIYFINFPNVKLKSRQMQKWQLCKCWIVKSSKRKCWNVKSSKRKCWIVQLLKSLKLKWEIVEELTF